MRVLIHNLCLNFVLISIVSCGEFSDYEEDVQSPLSPAYWRNSNEEAQLKSADFWPFDKERVRDSNPRVIKAKRPNFENRENYNDDYPIVLSQNPNSFKTPKDLNFYKYRPTELAYKLPDAEFERRPSKNIEFEKLRESPYGNRPPKNKRPFIQLNSQPQLPYGEPFVRIPYENEIRRKNAQNIAPVREYGPFSPNGPFGQNAELEKLKIRQPIREFSPFDQGQYAPKYRDYLPPLRFTHDMNAGTGEYNVEYEAANGIYRKETGFLKRLSVWNPATRAYEEKLGNVKKGTVSWISPEGIPFSFSYVSDENGYRPTPLIQGQVGNEIFNSKKVLNPS